MSERSPLPDTYTVHPDDHTSLSVRFGNTADGVAVLEYHVFRRDGLPITAEVHRWVADHVRETAEYGYARAVSESLAALLGPGTLTLNPGEHQVSVAVESGRIMRHDDELLDKTFEDAQRRRRRRRIDSKLLHEVATIYRENPSAPTKAVKAYYPVSRPQAVRYVRAAREAGLIPPRPEPKD